MEEKELISYEMLNNGELVGASIVEISKIPDFSIISSKYTSAAEASAHAKRGAHQGN